MFTKYNSHKAVLTNLLGNCLKPDLEKNVDVKNAINFIMFYLNMLNLDSSRIYTLFIF